MRGRLGSNSGLCCQWSRYPYFFYSSPLFPFCPSSLSFLFSLLLLLYLPCRSLPTSNSCPSFFFLLLFLSSSLSSFVFFLCVAMSKLSIESCFFLFFRCQWMKQPVSKHSDTKWSLYKYVAKNSFQQIQRQRFWWVIMAGLECHTIKSEKK